MFFKTFRILANHGNFMIFARLREGGRDRPDYRGREDENSVGLAVSREEENTMLLRACAASNGKRRGGSRGNSVEWKMSTAIALQYPGRDSLHAPSRFFAQRHGGGVTKHGSHRGLGPLSKALCELPSLA